MEGPSYRSVDVWRIGQYTVLRRLGEGGMGEVFAAQFAGLAGAVRQYIGGAPSRCTEMGSTAGRQ